MNWIAFTLADVERDLELFRGKTEQYIFISSASAYQKPLACPFVTESTPLCNPFWEYSRKKIACEERLNQAYRAENFPATIVRPSSPHHMFIPLGFAGGAIPPSRFVQRSGPAGRRPRRRHVAVDRHAFRRFCEGLGGPPRHQQALGHAFHITSDEVLTWD